MIGAWRVLCAACGAGVQPVRVHCQGRRGAVRDHDHGHHRGSHLHDPAHRQARAGHPSASGRCWDRHLHTAGAASVVTACNARAELFNDSVECLKPVWKWPNF